MSYRCILLEPNTFNFFQGFTPQVANKPSIDQGPFGTCKLYPPTPKGLEEMFSDTERLKIRGFPEASTKFVGVTLKGGE